MVRDKQGRKMSKSLGNSPDALGLLAQYGADGVRAGMLFSAAAGNDLLFDEKLCEQGRNFANKLWNAMRLVDMWEVVDTAAEHTTAHNWFQSKKDALLHQLVGQFDQFQLSEALKGIYAFAWDDFCSWYLEMVKPEYGAPISAADKAAIVKHFEDICVILHPYMPFITEELWHQLNPNRETDVCVGTWPKLQAVDNQMVESGNIFQDLVQKIREQRNKHQIHPKEGITIVLPTVLAQEVKAFFGGIQKLAGVSTIQVQDTAVEDGIAILVNNQTAYVILQLEVDVEAEIERIQTDINYQKGFLISVEKKLSNTKFVESAPEAVIAKEKQKQADALQRLEQLQASLAKLQA